MKFLRVFATDLFSYESLDISLADRGLLLVEGENHDLGGSNGSGKSSLFHVIVWTLFGKIPHYPLGDAVIREDAEHNPVCGSTKGFVEMLRGEDTIQVFRHRKHEEFGNKVLLYVNGKDLTMGSDSETTTRICQTMGMDYEAFIAAVMFPQGEAGFAARTDAAQKKTLDRILRTERFEVARATTKERLQPLLADLSSLQADVSSKNRYAGELEQQIHQMQANESQWVDDRASRLREAEDKFNQLQTQAPNPDDYKRVQDAIAQMSAAGAEGTDIRGTEQLIAQLRQESTATESRIAGIQGQLLHLPVAPATEPDVPARSVADIEAHLAKHDLETRDFELWLAEKQQSSSAQQVQLDRIKNSDNCPTCGQNVSIESQQQIATSIAADVAASTADISRAQEGLQTLRLMRRGLENEWVLAREYQAYLESRDAMQTRIALETEVASLTPRIGELKSQIEHHENRLATRRSYDEHQNWLRHADSWAGQSKAAKDLIDAVKAEQSPHLQTLTAMVTRHTETLQELEAADEKLTELVLKIDQLQFWDNAFGPKGVRSLLLDHVTPQLNSSANRYLDILSGGLAKMEFHTTKTLANGDQRDDFHVEVEYENGASDYRKISGGERQRPNLAAMFALGDLAASRAQSPIELRLLDEPFDNLDGLGAEQVVELLKQEIVPQSGTVLVMTHDDNLKSLITDRVTVVKENGVSKIAV